LKLKNLILRDGRIEYYVFFEGKIELKFFDYSNNYFLLIFENVSEIEENGSIGFSISDYKAYIKNEKSHFEIFDDDHKLMLKIIYKDLVIREI
jgi:hypothetical protein